MVRLFGPRLPGAGDRQGGTGPAIVPAPDRGDRESGRHRPSFPSHASNVSTARHEGQLGAGRVRRAVRCGTGDADAGHPRIGSFRRPASSVSVAGLSVDRMCRAADRSAGLPCTVTVWTSPLLRRRNSRRS